MNGKGVQRDINIARTWFERAATLSNVEAQENLRRLEQAALIDPAQVGARRTSCMQTCAALHRSYINSVCEHYSPTTNGGKPERTKCFNSALAVSRQCTDSCREWAATLLSENKCLTCFQALLPCSISQEPRNSQGDETSYALNSNSCLAALAHCTEECGGQPH